MRILLVDGDKSEGVVLAGQLSERGHDVVRCFPLEGHALCVGASDSSKCPVESLGCDVALVVRDDEEEPGLREMGAICAIRRHIPIIEARAESKSPFADWSTPAGTAVIEAVEDFDTGARPGLVTAIEARLATLPAVIRLGQLPTIAVRHVGSRLLMNITLPPGATPAEEESIVTWAVRCLREQDPYALTADVSVDGRGSAV